MAQRRPLMAHKPKYVNDSDNEDDDDDDNDLESGEFDEVIEVDLSEMREKRKRRLELQRIEDAQYEGEWGYALIKALRGKTVGRRIRRKLFKFGMFQLICGFALMMIGINEVRSFKNNEYMDNTKYGGSVMDLTWCVAFPSFFFGVVTMFAVKNWPSLVTNRNLLAGLLRVYMAIFMVIFIFTLWTTCVLFLTFKSVKNWSVDVTTQSILPYYICSIIFITPYLAVTFLYTLDISYLTDELEKGGTIAELDPPDDVKDLSDVTLFQSCVFVCAMPCILGIQCCDLVNAIKRAYNRYYRDEPLCKCPNLWLTNRTVSAEKAAEIAEANKKKKKTVWHRLWKTCVRCFTGSKKNAVKQSAVQPATTEIVTALPLKALEKDKEQEEREQREKVLLEQEAERQRIAQLEAEANAEFVRQQEAALQEAARKIQEQKLLEAQEEEERKKAEEAVNRWEAVLTVAQFKSLWSTFPTNGSFQCNLKQMPTVNQVVEHLKKQGFHIVFAVSPNANNIEVGICNVRPFGQPSWFMARFLAANNSFSAVMKSDNTEIVPAMVKKFALAKVLKIDTPGK